MKIPKKTVNLICGIFELLFAIFTALYVGLIVDYSHHFNEYYNRLLPENVWNPNILHIFVSHIVGLLFSCSVLVLIIILHVVLTRKKDG